MLEKFFKIKERNSSVSIEVVAGITTFLSMAYILFVNPDMLANTGMDKEAVFVSTAIAAMIGTLIMALYANYPVAQAPGMGMNAFFTFTVVLGFGYSWQEALFAIFVSGVIFLLVSLSGIREMIINAIPTSLKYAVSAGIGFFIAFIGLKNAGIIAGNDGTLVGFGDFTDPNVQLALVGTLITLFLVARQTKAAVFVGMLITAILGILFGLIGAPSQVVSLPPSLSPVFLKLFDVDIAQLLTSKDFWFIVLSILFLDFFDTAGTLMAVATRAGLINEKGELVDGERALVADASATTVGAMIGTSSVTSYVESIVGVESGAKTGLMALTVAGCFGLSLFFSPLLTIVTPAITAPALISVGAMMASSTKHIDYDDFADAAASFLTMLFMILAFSIAEGIAVGFLVYVVLKVAQRQAKEVNIIMYILALLFAIRYIDMFI